MPKFIVFPLSCYEVPCIVEKAFLFIKAGEERTMPITQHLEKNAKEFPDDIALIELNPMHDERKNLQWQEYELVETGHSTHYRKEITWSEFDKKANRFANMLIKRGVEKGDKVAILLMNCIDWLPIYFGILKTGAIVVPLNFRYTSEEIDYCLNLSDAEALIFGPEFLERLAEVRPNLKKINDYFFVGKDCPPYAISYDRIIDSFPAGKPEADIKDSDDGAIYFSSGTTGMPKAILHAHQSLMTAAEVEQKHHGQQKDDIFLLIPPLYHTGAKMHWFGSLLSGSKAIILKGTDPRWIMETASNEQASIVWLLVPWAQDILDAIERGEVELDKLDLKNWRLMHIGAQPVPPSLIRRWKKYFPEHAYDTNYGLSESIGPGAVHLGLENENKVGAIGKAGYKWEAKIIDEEGNIVKQGEVGELAIKGPGLMNEYYRDPEATAAVLVDGWLKTGDMAKEDEDGFIFLVDRKKDVIITGGENIYPVQVEDFLRKNNKIKDVAVIGIPDKRLGELAAAIIEVKPDQELLEQDVIEFAAELPRYKRPRVIIFDDIPRNPTGKIEKPKLREKYHADSIVAQQTANGD